MERHEKYTSAEEVRREERRKDAAYWLYSLVTALVVGVLVTSPWWFWVLLGLFIEAK